MHKWLKIYELQKMFGDPEGILIFTQTRHYVTEKSLYIFTSNLLTEKETEKIVRCYFLSDLLIISEIIEENEILFKSLYLDVDSFAVSLPQGKVIQNLFKV